MQHRGVLRESRLRPGFRCQCGERQDPGSVWGPEEERAPMCLPGLPGWPRDQTLGRGVKILARSGKYHPTPTSCKDLSRAEAACGVSNRGPGQGERERDGSTFRATARTPVSPAAGTPGGPLHRPSRPRAATTHVHTEDSKSLPSPSIHRSVGDGTCPWRADGGRGKEAPLLAVLGGKGLKIEASLTTPTTTTATTGCTGAEREHEHRDTEAAWKGLGAGTCRLGRAYLPPGSRQAAEYSLTVHSHLPVC